jgi:hypothetical protein
MPKALWEAHLKQLNDALGGPQALQEPQPTQGEGEVPPEAPAPPQAPQQPVQGPPPVQAPPIPAFQMDPQIAEDIGIVDPDKFNAFMAQRDQAIVAQVQATVQALPAETFGQMTQVLPYLLAAHAFQTENSQYREYPQIVQRAASEVIRANPDADPITIKELMAEHLNVVSATAKKIAAHHGAVAAPAPKGAAPSGRPTPKATRESAIDPTEAALADIADMDIGDSLEDFLPR